MERLLAQYQDAQSAAADDSITGLELSGQRWVTGAAQERPDIVAIPALDGALVFDTSARALAAGDFGGIASQMPWAVLFPGSIDDVERMVRFANQQQLRITGRGGLEASHSALGQSQAAAGIAIDMSSLCAVDDIEPDDGEIWVEAGASWRDVLRKTVPAGKSPPVFPYYLGLSVGGSLSVGGLGGQSHRSGFIVAHVRGLEVITGNGDRVMCSPTEQPFLFSSVLGGLGQFGIIVRACLTLREVVPRVRTFTLTYDNLKQFTADQARLIDDPRFHSVLGFMQSSPSQTSWRFCIEAASYGQPDDEALQPLASDPRLTDLSVDLDHVSCHDSDYLQFASRLDPHIAAMQDSEVWSSIHPLLSLIVPADQLTDFMAKLSALLPANDPSIGDILIHPVGPSETPSRYPVAPAGELNYVISIQRNVPTEHPKQAQALLAENRRLFEYVRRRGGTFYPAGALPLDPADWRAHFGRPLGWVLFGVAKRMFDHRFVLTPGQQIFRRS
ncbi:MAG: hypothetical protein Tsb0020_37850 [Haliangiales bacterium]